LVDDFQVDEQAIRGAIQIGQRSTVYVLL
jgi:hypothetical protein